MSTDLFPESIDGVGPPTANVLVELRRELAMRERVYPRWVEDDRIDQPTAAHRILCMRKAIALIEAHA